MAVGREKGDCSDNEVALDRSNTLLYHFFLAPFYLCFHVALLLLCVQFYRDLPVEVYEFS